MTERETPEQKILTGFAKIAVALREEAWKRSTDFGINPTQAQILTCIYDGGPWLPASHISASLGVSRASMSDSLGSLESKSLIKRKANREDSRSVLFALTPKGNKIAKELVIWPKSAVTGLDDLSSHEKATLLNLLLKTIRGLQVARKIPVSKMCITCTYFRPDQYPGSSEPHHCNLVNKPFGDGELRVHCPEHVEPVAGK
jgi:DNA-binding MarR family transcriptional regulator